MSVIHEWTIDENYIHKRLKETINILANKNSSQQIMYINVDNV